MKYEQLKFYSDNEIDVIIARGNDEEIKLLPLSLGEYHSDPYFVQDFCIYLLDTYVNDEIRANAVLGLSFIARRYKHLDNKIKPYLERESNENVEFNDRVKYSIEDINLFMEWS